MERRMKSTITAPHLGASRLWLATVEGRRLRQRAVAPLDRPELPMLIEFEGLTEAEQRIALAGFPGGRRFVLMS